MSKLKIFSSLSIVGILIVGILVATNQTQTRKIISSFAATPSASQDISLVNGNAAADTDGNGKVDILDFNTVVSNFGRRFDPVSGVVNVKAYGAKGDGLTDDTLNIQAAIDAARADPRTPGKVFFPHGIYIVSSLDLTKQGMVKLEGESLAGVQIRATNQTESQPIIDAAGSQYLEIENLQIVGVGSSSKQTPFKRFDGTSTGIPPSAGLFISPSVVNGQTFNSTKSLLENVFIYGDFTKAAFYSYGNCCSSYINVHFQSFRKGVPAMVLTAKNSIGMSSPHIPIPTGIQGSPDHTFTASEFHDLSNIYGENGSDDYQTILIEDIPSVTFNGGVMSTCGNRIVELRGDNKAISFNNISLVKNQESTGCPIPQYGIYAVNGRVDGLTLQNVVNEGFVKAVIGGNSGLFGVSIQGYNKSSYFDTNPYQLISLSNQNPTAWQIVDSLINANRMDITVGGSIISSKIVNPGQINTPPGATEDLTN